MLPNAKFDMNRPLMQRCGGGDFTIFMYLDNYGVYFDAKGREVPDELAKLAGYPVELYARKRDKQRAVALVDEEFMKVAAEESREVIERGPKGYTVVRVGEGLYTLEDPDGERFTKQPLSEAQIRSIMAQLDPPAEEEEVLVFPVKTAKKE